MTAIRQIEAYCQTVAPYTLADEWDNVGLLVGSDGPVSRVLLALDITPAVIDEARKSGAGLIISHHPVIFEPLRALTSGSAPYLLAQYGIAALCLHTNLDRAEQGVNAALADALGLKNRAFFADDYLLIGEPEQPMNADEFAVLVRDLLGAPSVRYTDGRVTRIAVSSGGGGGGVALSDPYGFNAFLTGELKHHQYLYAVSNGIAAFDAGHFSTENVILEPLRERLTAAFPDVDFSISEHSTCPYRAV